MTERTYPGSKGDFATPSYEGTPLARPEYISVLVHYYRGELHRSTQWRLRLDNTTNWAIFSVMGLITFSLGDPLHSHVGILAGMVLVLTFLGIEARRFRFFDVWRSRVRMLEENFIGPVLRRDLHSPLEKWGTLVADDLLHPRFKITHHQAIRARLLRNYGVLFLLLLVSWFLKLVMLPSMYGDGALIERMAVGPVPGWLALAFVAALYGYLALVIALVPSVSPAEDAYWGGGNAEDRVSRIDV